MRREKRRATHKLIEYAAQAPHIHRMVIVQTQYYLRCSIVSTLHIKEPSGAIFTTGSKVYNFNSIILFICEQNILRLHITMNDALILHIFQALAYLP